jgi:hypothetical protein
MLFATQQFDATGKCVAVHFYHHSEVERWQNNVGHIYSKPEKLRSRRYNDYIEMLDSNGIQHFISLNARIYLRQKGIIDF